MNVSVEVQRLIDRGMPLPSLDVKTIPYDDIIVTSGKHQVRRMNISEDKILTHQIESQGLMNPIIVMPFGDTGKFVPMSGHTRHKSCKTIATESLTRAKELELDKGIPCYVYDEEITDIETFRILADILNDHPQSNPTDRADQVDGLLSLYGQGYFVKNGKPDAQAMLMHLRKKKLAGFSDRALGGIIETVVNTIKKSSRLEDFAEGSIVTYENKKHLNGKLFAKFDISDNSNYDHFVENENGIVANSIRGIAPSNSLWVTEQLSSFADFQMDLEDHGIVPDERILYWHVRDIIDCGEDETALRCLNKTRMNLLNTARKKARAFMPDYRPTKIAFIPQFQISVDENGNEVFGEEVTYYEM